jgi:hypothetical protein
LFKKRRMRILKAVVFGIFAVIGISIVGLIVPSWFKDSQTILQAEKPTWLSNLSALDSALAEVIIKYNGDEDNIVRYGRESILKLFPVGTKVTDLVEAFRNNPNNMGACTEPDHAEQIYPGTTKQYGRTYRCWRRFRHPLSTTVFPENASKEEAKKIFKKALREQTDPFLAYPVVWRLAVSVDEDETRIKEIEWIDFSVEGP